VPCATGLSCCRDRKERELPAEDRLVLQWVAKASRPLVDVHDPVLARDVLELLRRGSTGARRRWRRCAVNAKDWCAPSITPLNGVNWAAIRWTGSAGGWRMLAAIGVCRFCG